MKQIINLNEIKKASFIMTSIKENVKNRFLIEINNQLLARKTEIVKANKRDILLAKKNSLSASFIQRLALNNKGINCLIQKINSIINLNSNIGEIIENKTTTDSLMLQKIRVPIGTILIIYEARPEVTIDIASLCIKSGNIAILKGGSEAINTNTVLFSCISNALKISGLPKYSVNFICNNNKRFIYSLLKKNHILDLVIARGNYEMVQTIINKSNIPVLAHASGGSRIYIDKSADKKIINNILINAKTNKPAACNSLDTIVLHRNLVKNQLSKIINVLNKENVEIINNVYDKEFLDYKVSIKIVNDENEAIKFINKYSNKHTEGIISQNNKVIQKFTDSVDTAAIFVNCSTRLHDGYVFDLGSEIGIATGKLHARGPVSLKELTTYKWIVYGNGQIRN